LGESRPEVLRFSLNSGSFVSTYQPSASFNTTDTTQAANTLPSNIPMSTRASYATCLILLASCCFGQDSVGTSSRGSGQAIGITVGVNQLSDENLLPRVHTGLITTLSYVRRSVGESFSDCSLSLSFSRIIAKGEDVTKSANGLIAASSAYAMSVVNGDRLRCFVGPQAQARYSVSLYPNWDDSHLYWANVLSVGFTNVAFYTFDDNTVLLAEVNLPILSLQSRPDALRLYKFDDASFGGIVRNLHHDLTAGFVSSVLHVHIGMEYQFPAFQTKTEAVFFSFDYTRMVSSNALPFRQLQYQLGLRMFL
jgi:hypothetical protein